MEFKYLPLSAHVTPSFIPPKTYEGKANTNIITSKVHNFTPCPRHTDFVTDWRNNGRGKKTPHKHTYTTFPSNSSAGVLRYRPRNQAGDIPYRPGPRNRVPNSLSHSLSNQYKSPEGRWVERLPTHSAAQHPPPTAWFTAQLIIVSDTEKPPPLVVLPDDRWRPLALSRARRFIMYTIIIIIVIIIVILIRS